jgi:hypothetical protein
MNLSDKQSRADRKQAAVIPAGDSGVSADMRSLRATEFSMSRREEGEKRENSKQVDGTEASCELWS